MHVDIEFAVWYLISWLRQIEQKLWKVFSDKGNGTVERLELYKCPTMT
jgi:hypothetical protein